MIGQTELRRSHAIHLLHSLLRPGKTRDMYRLILLQTVEVLLRANAPNVMSLNVWVFIAQLAEHRSSYGDALGLSPVEALKLFSS